MAGNPREQGVSPDSNEGVRSSSRRRFLEKAGKTATWVGLAGTGVGAIVAGESMGEVVEIFNRADRKYPRLPKQDVKRAQAEAAIFEQKVKDLARGGRLDQVSQVADPQKIQKAYEILYKDTAQEREVNRMQEERDLKTRFLTGLGIITGGLTIFGFGNATLEDEKRKKQKAGK